MTSMQLYWLLMLDRVVGLCITGIGVGVAAAVILVIVGVYRTCDCGESRACYYSSVNRYVWGVFILLVLSITGVVFVPPTKQMAAIIVIPKVCSAIENSEEVQALPGKLVELAGEWLDELRPEQEAPASLEVKATPDTERKGI